VFSRFSFRQTAGLAVLSTLLGACWPGGDFGRDAFGDRGVATPKEVLRARAEVAGEGITGNALLIEYAIGDGRVVKVILNVKGDPTVLTPGLHGVHVHSVGVCEAPFKSAGGHFDPGPAGNTDPDVNHPYHLGDLPNLAVSAAGEGHLYAYTNRFTLSEGPLSVFDTDGSALIIHKQPDLGISGAPQSGVAGGARIACGVIRRLGSQP